MTIPASWVKIAERKGSFSYLSPDEREKVIAVVRAAASAGAYTNEESLRILAEAKTALSRKP